MMWVDLERKKIMKKTLSCIAAFIPIIGVVVGFCTAMLYLIAIEASGNDVNVVFMLLIYGLLCIGVLMCWVDIFWFIYLAIKNKQLDNTMKIIWCVLLYMLNIFVFPVFWFMVIRKEEP